MASTTDELKRVPLFSGLSQRQLRRLASLVQKREYGPGVTLVRENEMSGVGFFIITEGEASVGVDGTQVARLGPGDFFGELALISDRVRAATVTVETPLRCFVMASWDFRTFAKDNPDVAWKLLEHLVELLVRGAGSARPGRAPGQLTA